MSDQNLPNLNESNQMINAQPETAANQITPPSAIINGNLFVTNNVSVGLFSLGNFQGQIEATGPVAEFGFVRRDLTSWPTQPAAGDRFVWYNPDGTARLFTEVKGDLLAVTPSGNVGIGTNNPQSMLHIGDEWGGGYRPWMVRGTLVSQNSDTVFFGLKNEGSDRKDAVIAWGDNPEDAFRFIFTADKGSAEGQEIMRLQPNGYVGIGTTNPLQYGRLTIQDASVPLAFRESDRAVTEGGLWRMPLDAGMLRFDVNASASGNFSPYITPLLMYPNGDIRGGQDVYANRNVYANGILLTSSRELKENIAELSGKEAVEALKNLNPVKFNFKADSDKNRHIGFIAEDVPELVATSDRRTLSPMDIVAVLTQALKEQQNTISSLVEKVKILEAKTA
jgi:hypothetical protein